SNACQKETFSTLHAYFEKALLKLQAGLHTKDPMAIDLDMRHELFAPSAKAKDLGALRSSVIEFSFMLRPRDEMRSLGKVSFELPLPEDTCLMEVSNWKEVLEERLSGQLSEDLNSILKRHGLARAHPDEVPDDGK